MPALIRRRTTYHANEVPVFFDALLWQCSRAERKNVFLCSKIACYFSDKCKKTAAYTNVNGDTVSYTSKTAKIKKLMLSCNTSPNVNVLLSNIICVLLTGTV